MAGVRSEPATITDRATAFVPPAPRRPRAAFGIVAETKTRLPAGKPFRLNRGLARYFRPPTWTVTFAFRTEQVLRVQETFARRTFRPRSRIGFRLAGAIEMPGPFPVNTAPTFIRPSTVTVQGPVPVQPPPDHLVNLEPEEATGFRVTSVPGSNGAAQLAPHTIPAGEEVTDPKPLPG